MTTDDHNEARKLAAFQYWLATNYTTLPSDSHSMTERAVLYLKETGKLSRGEEVHKQTPKRTWLTIGGTLFNRRRINLLLLVAYAAFVTAVLSSDKLAISVYKLIFE